MYVAFGYVRDGYIERQSAYDLTVAVSGGAVAGHYDGYLPLIMRDAVVPSSGGAVAGGDAPASRGRAIFASGGGVMSGAGVILRGPHLAATGGAVAGGDAPITIFFPGFLFRSPDEMLWFADAPERPRRNVQPIQAQLVTPAGHRTFGDVIADDQRIALRWPRLSAGNKDALIDWWHRVARGMSHAFYVRVNGTEYQGRFASGQLPTITERTPDRFDVRIEILVEP